MLALLGFKPNWNIKKIQRMGDQTSTFWHNLRAYWPPKKPEEIKQERTPWNNWRCGKLMLVVLLASLGAKSFSAWIVACLGFSDSMFIGRNSRIAKFRCITQSFVSEGLHCSSWTCKKVGLRLARWCLQRQQRAHNGIPGADLMGRRTCNSFKIQI